MKKFLFLSVCILFSANAFSQLKVANNGNPMFGLSSSETPLSAISVGSIGRADSKLTVLGDNNGIFAYRMVMPTLIGVMPSWRRVLLEPRTSVWALDQRL